MFCLFADSFEKEWTYSEHPGKEFGKFVHSSGAFYNDAEADKGIQTSQDARFYALSKKFNPFSNEGKDLVIQYTVKHEQNIDCGGGYVKLFNCDLEPKKMHGETPYEIMFGKYLHFYSYILTVSTLYEFSIFIGLTPSVLFERLLKFHDWHHSC